MLQPPPPALSSRARRSTYSIADRRSRQDWDALSRFVGDVRVLARDRGRKIIINSIKPALSIGPVGRVAAPTRPLSYPPYSPLALAVTVPLLARARRKPCIVLCLASVSASCSGPVRAASTSRVR